jgi:hypothetical protein
MRVILAVLALAAVPTALAGSTPAPTVLPKPAFPPPAGEVGEGTSRLVLVSSRYRDPARLPPDRPGPPRWVPKSYRSEQLESAIRQRGALFLVYGGRMLVGANPRNQGLRYGLDLTAYMRPPKGGELEPVTWAREVDGILYVSNSHLTYASATKGRNAYVSAIDLARRKTLWRSPALVANARTFVVTDDLIVAGYGFTAEPDFLYLLDRRTGKVLDRLAVASAPEVIKLRGDTVHVRTYDRQVAARIVR